MSIAGYPMDHGDQGPHDDGRATPAGGPPADWDAQFTAIVSGISGDMRWEATPAEWDSAAGDAVKTGQAPGSAGLSVPRAPDSIWTNALPDTAEDRRARRQLRRLERAEELAAFQQAQEELEAARAADTEHYEPPEPPPLPKLQRRTVGALTMIVMGLVLVIFPTIMPASFEFVAIAGAMLLVGGGAILFNGLRRHHGDSGDDGSRV